MNADNQDLTQPENQEHDDEERLLASDTPGEESTPVQPLDETPEETAPEDESVPGETTAGEHAETVQPVSETLGEEAPPGESEADENAQPIQPVGETPEEAAPNSAAPPRIISETPLGGTPRTHTVVSPEPSPGGAVEKYEIQDATKEIPPRALVRRLARPAEDSTPTNSTPPAPKPTPAAPTPTPAAPPAPAPPDQPPSRVKHTEPPARPEDWADEDISPELAAVLFGERKPEAETPPTPAAQPTAAEPATAPPRPAPETAAELPAEPIALTEADTARRLRLTADGHSAAAPEAALQGKARYVRIEQPLNRDKGQRITESWRYFKPDYPSLEGRLVKAVESEEIQYADGSWYWKYERRYSDGGRDRREVRANTDRSYVERHDEVSKLAAQAGKRVLYREDAAMILAEPEREEKRGFLSGLLGRDEDKGGTTKAWREATAPESRHARKNGGEALRRRFLGIF